MPTETLTPANNSPWSTPANSANLVIECFGGGGGGGNSDAVKGGNAGGGGGAGAYSKLTIASPSGNYSFSIGANATAQTNGASTWFGSNTTCYAEGGFAGATVTRGLGGSNANGYGDVKYSGGAGYNGVINSVGGGGGEGGYASGNGTTASSQTGASGTAGGDGGNGGAGHANGTDAPTASGNNGGGGGGAGHTNSNGTTMVGGNGAAGKIILTYDIAPTLVNLTGIGSNASAANTTPFYDLTLKAGSNCGQQSNSAVGTVTVDTTESSDKSANVTGQEIVSALTAPKISVEKVIASGQAVTSAAGNAILAVESLVIGQVATSAAATGLTADIEAKIAGQSATTQNQPPKASVEAIFTGAGSTASAGTLIVLAGTDVVISQGVEVTASTGTIGIEYEGKTTLTGLEVAALAGVIIESVESRIQGVQATSAAGQVTATSGATDSEANITGQQATSATGILTISQDMVVLSGVQATVAVANTPFFGLSLHAEGKQIASAVGTLTVSTPSDQTANVTGQQSTASAGNPTVDIGGISIPLTGVSVTADLNDEGFIWSIEIIGTVGQSVTTSAGSLTAQTDSVSANITGQGVTASAGSVKEAIEVKFNGEQVSSSVGSPTIIYEKLVGLTGIEASSGYGSLKDEIDILIAAGQQASSQVGSVSTSIGYAVFARRGFSSRVGSRA